MNRFMLAIIASVTLATAPVAAAQHGSKPQQAPANTTHPTAPHDKPSTSSHGKPATSVKPGTNGKPAPGSKKTTTTTTTSTSPKTTSSTTPTTTLTPVQQKLQRNTNLASKLQSRLPAGTDLLLAAKGFRNLGQFVAAVNVSHNLNIPFADLKTKMVTDHMSLGQSIQTLKKVSNPTHEAERAESEARTMIGESDDDHSTATKGTTTAKPKTTTTAAKK